MCSVSFILGTHVVKQVVSIGITQPHRTEGFLGSGVHLQLSVILIP